jgi:hypothetical protein
MRTSIAGFAVLHYCIWEYLSDHGTPFSSSPQKDDCGCMFLCWVMGMICSEKSKHHREGDTTFAILSSLKNNWDRLSACMRVHVLTTGGMYYYCPAGMDRYVILLSCSCNYGNRAGAMIARLDCPRVLMIEGFESHTGWSGGRN